MPETKQRSPTLVFDFVEARLPDDYDRVRVTFRRRGAYMRLKDFPDGKGLLDAWHQCENEKTLEALRDWCAEGDRAGRVRRMPAGRSADEL